MKLGVTLPNIELGVEPGPIADLAQAAEAIGYDYLMAYDHVIGADLSVRPDWKPFFGNPPVYTIDDPFHEPLVLYGYLAAVTKKIELATGVVISPQRQTVLLAKQAAEVDILSGGRMRLGIGIGWNDLEYQALNEDFKTRGARSAEQIVLMRKLWTQRSVAFDGKWHKIEAMGMCPLPIQQPIPIFLGGEADPVLKRIAELADGWYAPSYLNEDQLKEKISKLHGYARAIGRDPRAIAIEGIIRMYGRTPEACVESLGMWKRLGATHVTFNTESDSYRRRLPSAQMESRGQQEDYSTMEPAASMAARIKALSRFFEASRDYVD
ncbi:MAG: LLM class F420-dependent oxidoreductase [Pseudomonadota bacterium]|nr:LLM class F420-dependent oxidoreductase [Pseudomonadota bacterium]